MPQLPYQLPSFRCAVLIQSIAFVLARSMSSRRYCGCLRLNTDSAVTPVRRYANNPHQRIPPRYRHRAGARKIGKEQSKRTHTPSCTRHTGTRS